jgi:hypothetical protein
MSNKSYDILKDIALILPLVITLVGAVMEIWGIPYADKVVYTLTAINAFIAGLVKIANKLYILKNKKGK